MTPDGELLERYVSGRSEEAFAEVVRRHLDLVFSAALRQVNGDAHLARDVAQSVFADLARKAPSLMRRPALTGWLYTSTHFAAAKAVRTEQRRRAHEQEAFAMNEWMHDPAPEVDWQKLRPALDQVMHKLKEGEREVLLMRFFENRPLADIGRRLGLSEDAARKRVDRALERLRALLAKSGITTAGSLAAMLSAHAVETAPSGLAASLASASLAAAASGTASAPALLKILSMTKLQTAALSALVLASAVTSALIVQNAQARVRQIDQSHQQVLQRPALEAENARLSNAVVRAGNVRHLEELARVRDEVAALRAKTNGLAALKQEHGRLQAALEKARKDLDRDPSLQMTTNTPELHSRIGYGMSLFLAMLDYAEKNKGQYPTNLNDVIPFLHSGAAGNPGNTDTNLSPDLFELAYQGTMQSTGVYAHRGDIVLLIEKNPWMNADGKWVKAWVGLNGIGRICCPVDGDFDSWESQHIVSSSDPSDP